MAVQRFGLLLALFGLFPLVACDAGPVAHAVVAPGSPPVDVQRGNGQPYEVLGSQVVDVPDPVSGRTYQIFVALPPSYDKEPGRRYPVVYVTDADYAFPVVRAISRRMNNERPRIEEHILVGLSYAKGEGGRQSRNRDYTPTAKGADDAPADHVHGGGAAYRDHIAAQVMPHVNRQFRTSPGRDYFIGHSYGGLLGAQIMFTKPGMFAGYVLGSPSFWYDQRMIFDLERATAANRRNLAAKVYLYIGSYEAARPDDPRYYKSLDMVRDNQKFADTLRSRGYADLILQSDVLEDEDHVSVAPRGFTKGLLFLLPAT